MRQHRADVVAMVRSGRTRSGRGRVRFSEKARQAAVEHVREELARGGSTLACAREMGVAYQTVRRWMRDAGDAFRPVQVEATVVNAAEVVVTLPGGVRVVGLDIAGVAELCRLLR